MRLYDIDLELEDLSRMLDDSEGEISDEDSARFDELMDQRESKIDGYLALLKNAEDEEYTYMAEATRFQKEADRYKELAGTPRKMAERLKHRLMESMRRNGEMKLQGRLGKVHRQRTVSSRIELLVDPADLPERFLMAPQPNKTAIKQAIADMDDEVIRMAEIVKSESEHLRIS